MRCTKRYIARYLVSLLLLAAMSHSVAGLMASNHVLALSQAACDHCQMLMIDEGVDYQPLNLSAAFEPLPEAPQQPISLPINNMHQAPVALLMQAPYPTKVRLHLLHCVMRD